tara:strand:+ start:4425 stop:5117 length:693 start_codon:yes stop_codon:yes gene_type:complete
MIKTQIDEIDSTTYVYDTGLTFGSDFGRRILESTLTHLEMFPLRSNYNKANAPKELIRLIGPEKARELYRRTAQMKNLCPGNLIEFTQHFFPDALGQELVSLAPKWMQDLSPGEPSPMLQVSKNGEYLGTHKGHKRRASLFMLLQGSGQETRWYRNKEDFEVIDPLRIPDHDKIEHVVTAVMEPWRWYVFNHFEWHSVHNFAPGSVRINMGLDFNDITAQELVAQSKKHV